jgi:tetratricopeptide (TPR) repeat protein
MEPLKQGCVQQKQWSSDKKIQQTKYLWAMQQVKTFWWAAVGVNSLFFIWPCLDRFLVPRFFFLSAVLLCFILLNWRALGAALLSRWHWFDGLLLGWYGLNLAAVGWSFSWEEGIFYAQKVLLLWLTYRLTRLMLQTHYDASMRTLSQVFTVLTWVVSGLLLFQLSTVLHGKNFDNNELYNVAVGAFGNKSLSSDFLFFLLVGQFFFLPKQKTMRWLHWAGIALLLGLIFILQVRTVYIAVVAAGLLYALLRAGADAAFRPVLLRRVLPVALLILSATIGVAVWKGGTLSERLNPMTYLESESFNERRFVWYKTDFLNADYPLLGVGAGSWKFLLPSKSLEGAYRLQEKGIVFTRAHNDYLEVRSEMGWVGVLWFVALFVAAAFFLLLALRRVDNARSGAQIAAIGAGLLGYCIIQYFDFPRERIEMQVILALFFAFSVHFYTQNKQGYNGPQVLSKMLQFAVVIGLVFNLYMGYQRIVGEIHNVKMIKYLNIQNYEGVIREAKAARNTFYRYNDVAMPMEWFEGLGHYKLNRNKEAADAFAAAYPLNPWNFQVVNNYALALVTNKEYQKAIEYFERAVTINPRYDEGKFNLAYTHLQLRDTTAAITWVNRVDTIANPKNPEDIEKNKVVLRNKRQYLQGLQRK